jgi:hypothetical protein
MWTTPVEPNAALDPRSTELVNSLKNTIRSTTVAGRPPWIAIGKCSYREYVEPATQPNRRVTLTNPTVLWRQSLAAAFANVPIPDHAVPTDCSDSVVVVRQPSTNKMWELWKARRTVDGWHAEWGAATNRFSTNPGSYGPNDWTGAQYNWGASASSMTLHGGTVLLKEWQRGVIDHAVALTIPQVAAGVWAWPAQRTDGKLTTANAIPYGARFRLDPRLNIDALKVPAATKTLARAVQRFGFVVREQTGWAVGIPSQAPPIGTPSPYPQIFGGTPGPIMSAFPWDRLQLLRMDLRSTAGPPAW